MGKSIDRSKFKNLGTQVSDMYAADKELNQQMGRKGGGPTRPGYLDIDKDGSLNLFRIYPPHPEEDGGGLTFSEPKVTVFLPIELPKRDDQGNIVKEKGKEVMEVKRKAIFNATIHGNAPKDLIDEYINIARKRADEWWPDFKVDGSEDKAARAKFLGFIYGAYNSKDPKKSIQGINYQQAWVMYADKIDVNKGKKQFGRLEIKKSIKDRLNALAALESSGQPLGVDPFTDIDEGRAITIRYDKEATMPANYYVTEFDNIQEIVRLEGGKQAKSLRTFPLSDEDLENWSKQEPLAKMFKNVFKKSDFAYQLEGLERHDKEHGLGIWDDEEFQEVALELSEYYADMPDEDEVQSTSKSSKDDSPFDSKGTDEEDQDEDGNDEDPEEDQYDLMDREELKAEIKKRKLGIVVNPRMKEEKLRDILREDDLLQTEDPDDLPELLKKDPEVEREIETKASSVRNKVAASQKNKAKQAVEKELENDLPWDEDGNDIRPRTMKTTTSDRMAAMKARFNKTK